VAARNMPQVSSAQNRADPSAAGKRRRWRRGQVIRARGQHLHWQFLTSAPATSAGNNYTQALKDRPQTPSELISVYERQSDGRRSTRPDKLWFYAAFRQVGAKNTCRHVVNRNAAIRTPDGRFRQEQAAFTDSIERQRTTVSHGSDAAKQVQFPLGRAVQRRELQRGGTATQTMRRRAGRTTSRPGSPPSWSSPVSGLPAEAAGDVPARYRFGIRNDARQPLDDG